MFNIGKINTKKDHLAEFQAAIQKAIEIAIDNKVSLADLARELKGRGVHFQRMIDDAIERRMNDPNPTMYDPITYAPIDGAAIARRAEEQRAARQLREQQAPYQEALKRRSNA